jgi:predicted dehydrogenase
LENIGKKVKVAVIGTGKLGAIHSRIYGEIPQADLIGVCDINRERAEEAAASCGVRAFTDFRELFSLVEAVSIAVPTRLHYAVAHEFLKRGKHVLVEKPFTSTLPEAGRLIREAARNRCTLQVGHVERFNSAFTATQNLIKNPLFIECHRLSPFPNRSIDVGVVLDLMIHDIDIVQGLVNGPLKKVEAVGVEVLTPFEDIANARLTFETGCICNLTVSRVSDELMRKIRIFQKNTYISLDYRKEEAFIYTKTPTGITRESLPIEKEEPLKKELSSFLDCVIKRQAPIVTGEIARNALAVALQIQKQIWKNKPKIS